MILMTTRKGNQILTETCTQLLLRKEQAEKVLSKEGQKNFSRKITDVMGKLGSFTKSNHIYTHIYTCVRTPPKLQTSNDQNLQI